MNEPDISHIFLTQYAAKHFVCLSYKVKQRDSNDVKSHFASCFIIKIEEQWLLITAGHVISQIRKAILMGASCSDFNLHDRLAGHAFRFSGIPIAFSVDDWAVIDNNRNDEDYAAMLIRTPTISALQAGGVQPIEECAFGTTPFEQYPYWLLVGCPDETHEIINEIGTLKLTLIPLGPATVPDFERESPLKDKVCAQIISRPNIDSVTVTDITGMSGGPIFGLRKINGTLKYWVIGIQSTWYKPLQIVFFCPIQNFFSAIKNSITSLGS